MRTWLCLAVFVAGCSKSEDPSSQPPPPPPPSGAQVQIFVNDQLVAKVEPPQLAGWPRLDTLVPVQARRMGTWELIAIKGKSEKPAEIAKPSDSYRDLVPAVFPGEGGVPAFGMFDPVELAKKGKPQLREDAAREIRIKVSTGTGRGEHESGEGGGTDPSQLVVTIKTASGETALKGDKLLAIKREPQPGETGEGKGWTLATVLDAAGVKTYERLRLTDAGGTNLTLEKADLDPKTAIPFIKLNRQGSLRFRVYKKQGDGWQASGDLRALAMIEVLK